jgi:hypothetical protein
MNTSENKAALRKARKDKLVAGFRTTVGRLNTIEDRLHAGGLTAKENDDLLTEYRNLSVCLTRLEDELANDFGINTERL